MSQPITPNQEQKEFAIEIVKKKLLHKDWSNKTIYEIADSIGAAIAHKLAKEGWTKKP